MTGTRRLLGAVLTALLVIVGVTATANAARAAGLGFVWTHTVSVYDGTGAASWKVSEAAAEWSANSGFDAVMTTDQATADVVVVAVDQMSDWCGATSYGCTATPAVQNGVAVGTCTVFVLASVASNAVLAEHTAAHELGHCAGLAHSSSTKSIMYPRASGGGLYLVPQSPDYRDMQQLYGKV